MLEGGGHKTCHANILPEESFYMTIMIFGSMKTLGNQRGNLRRKSSETTLFCFDFDRNIFVGRLISPLPQ